MNGSKSFVEDDTTVVASHDHADSPGNPSPNSIMTPDPSPKSNTPASNPAPTPTTMPRQHIGPDVNNSITNPTTTPITPIPPIQPLPAPPLPKTSTPETTRTGGRRGRGMRHRGTQMLGGSMSVFSIRPDGPRTPTSRARGSIRSKQSSRTPSGSANNNNGSNENSSDKKRKRDDQGGASDSESSEVITPLSQSRSGRKIVQSTPVIKIAGDEVRSGGSPIKGGEKGSPAVRHGSVAKAVVVVEGKKKNRSGSKKTTPGGAAAVCKNCGRLHSPQSNAMVFCDGCNTGWHQHCHDPPISQDIVLIESKEWFCTDCVVLKEEKSRLHGKVSGQHMSLLDKRRHLQTLSPKELVSLLLHACSVHPELPIFNSSAVQKAAEDLYDDEDDLPYPKPGNGLVLPPEKDHLFILLDDDTDVYSHCTSGIAQLVAAARANLLRKSTMALQQSIGMNGILVE